jgi:hypothetical protein
MYDMEISFKEEVLVFICRFVISANIIIGTDILEQVSHFTYL